MRLLSLLLLLLLWLPAQAQVRVVSLVPDQVLQIQFAGFETQLKPMSASVDIPNAGGLHHLVVKSSDGVLLDRKIGVDSRDRIFLVVFGVPTENAEPSWWSTVRAHFLGQGEPLKKHERLQVEAFSGDSYFDRRKAYICLFHGATTTSGLTLKQGSRRARAEYAGHSDFVAVEPGQRHLHIVASDTSLDLWQSDLNLEPASLYLFFVGRDNAGAGKLRVLKLQQALGGP